MNQQQIEPQHNHLKLQINIPQKQISASLETQFLIHLTINDLFQPFELGLYASSLIHIRKIKVFEVRSESTTATREGVEIESDKEGCVLFECSDVTKYRVKKDYTGQSGGSTTTQPGSTTQAGSTANTTTSQAKKEDFTPEPSKEKLMKEWMKYDYILPLSLSELKNMIPQDVLAMKEQEQLKEQEQEQTEKGDTSNNNNAEESNNNTIDTTTNNNNNEEKENSNTTTTNIQPLQHEQEIQTPTTPTLQQQYKQNTLSQIQFSTSLNPLNEPLTISLKLQIHYHIPNTSQFHLSPSLLYFSAHHYNYRSLIPLIGTPSINRSTWLVEYIVPIQYKGRDLLVVSSGELLKQKRVGLQEKVCVYEISQPVSVMGLCFAIGCFVVGPIRGMGEIKGYVFAPHSTANHTSGTTAGGTNSNTGSNVGSSTLEDDLQNSTSYLSNCLEYYTQYCGISYPFPSYKLLFLPLPLNHAIHGPSLSILSTRYIMKEGDVDFVYDSRMHICTALADQWFGECLFARGERDQWICVGLGGYLSGMFLRKVLGYNSYRFFLREKMKYLYDNDHYYGPLYQSHSLSSDKDNEYSCEEYLEDHHYLKAPLIIYLLEKSIGRNMLQKIVNKILVSQISGDLTQGLSTQMFMKFVRKWTGRDLQRFWERWVFGSGVPFLDVEWVFVRKRNMVEMVIRQPFCSTEGVTSSKSASKSGSQSAGSGGQSGSSSNMRPLYVGPLTVRIHEPDGTFDHVLKIDSPLHHFSLLYYTKYKRLRTNKKQQLLKEKMEVEKKQEEVQMGLMPPVGTELDFFVYEGDLFMRQLKGHSEFLDTDAEAQLFHSPIAYFRLDPDLEIMCEILFKQSEYMNIQQIMRERDIIGQLEAVERLGKEGGRKGAACLARLVGDVKVFWGVRVEAAKLLGKNGFWVNIDTIEDKWLMEGWNGQLIHPPIRLQPYHYRHEDGQTPFSDTGTPLNTNATGVTGAGVGGSSTSVGGSNVGGVTGNASGSSTNVGSVSQSAQDAQTQESNGVSVPIIPFVTLQPWELSQGRISLGEKYLLLMFQKKFCVYSQQMVQNGKLLTRRNDFSVLSEYFVMKGIIAGLGLLKNDTQTNSGATSASTVTTHTDGSGSSGGSSKEGSTLQERIGKILLGILEMNDNALNTTDDTSFISTLITAIGHILPPITTSTTSTTTSTSTSAYTSSTSNVLINQALVQMRNLLFLETLIPSVRNQIGISILKVLRDWIRKGVLDSSSGTGSGKGESSGSVSGKGESSSSVGSAVSGIFWVMIGGRNGLDIRRESVNGLLDRGLYIDVFMYAMSYITVAGTAGTSNGGADSTMTTGNTEGMTTGTGESAGNEDNSETRSRKRRKYKKGFVRMDCEWSIRVYILDRVFKDVLYILETGRMPPFRLSDTAVGEEERAVGVSSGVGSGGSGVGARGGESKSTSKLVGAAVEEDLGGAPSTANTGAGTGAGSTNTNTTTTTTNNTSTTPTEIINFFSSPKTKHFIIKAIEHDWTPFRIKLLLCSFYESFYSMFKEMEEKKERQRFLELEILKERESAGGGGAGGGVGVGGGGGAGGGGVGVGGGIKLKIKLPVLQGQGQQEVASAGLGAGSASGVAGETKVLPKLKLRVSAPLLGSSTGTVGESSSTAEGSTAVEAVVGSTAAIERSESTAVKKSRIIKLRIPRRIIRLIKPTSDDAAEGAMTGIEENSSMDVDTMTTTDNIATTTDTTDNNENTDIK